MNANVSGGTGDNTYSQRGWFITPDICNGTLVTPKVGMVLKIKQWYTTAVDSFFTSYYLFKYYNLYLNRTDADNNIEQITFVDFNGDTFDNSGTPTPVANRTKSPGNASYGNAGYYFRATNMIPYDDTISGGGKFLCNIETTLTKQYGGNTYTARSQNEYISCSHYRPIKLTNTNITDEFTLYGGDTFVNMYDSMRLAKRLVGTGGGGAHSTVFFFPVESCVNTDLRHGVYTNKNLSSDAAVIQETYTYNSIYSAENTIKSFFPKPDPFIFNEEFNNRFHASEVKINGELSDSWRMFKSLNYYDVEGLYGPINAASVLQDQVYFGQDRAFGKLLVNPKIALTSTDGAEVQIGKGEVLDNHEYISIETGTKHQFSWLQSAYNIYFYDTRHKKFYSFSQNSPLNPISDLKGMHSWINTNIVGLIEDTDKPVYNSIQNGINGIHGVYDYLNNELLYTILISIGNQEVENPIFYRYTLVFSEKLNCFTGFYSHTPKIYITNHKDFLSCNPNSLQTIYLHNYGDYGNFYGAYKISDIEFFVNKYPESTKVFTNFMLQTEVQNGTTLVDTDRGLTPVEETFNLLDVSTDHQNNSINLVSGTNIKRKFRSWKLEVPRHSVNAAYVSNGFFAKLMDKYMKVKFSFTNNGNKRFILHSIFTFFKIHNPK